MADITLTAEQIHELDNSVESYFKNLLEIPIVESLYNSKNKITRKTSFIKFVVINDNDPIPDSVQNIYYDFKYCKHSQKRFIFYYDNNETNMIQPTEYFELLETFHSIFYDLTGINKMKSWPHPDYAICTADYINNKFKINYTPATIILFIGLCILNNLSFKLLHNENDINTEISKLNVTKEEYLENNIYIKYNYQFLGVNITLNYNDNTKILNIKNDEKNINDIDLNDYFKFLIHEPFTNIFEYLSRINIILYMLKDPVKSLGM